MVGIGAVALLLKRRKAAFRVDRKLSEEGQGSSAHRVGDTGPRTLGRGDVLGLRALYP